MHACLVSIFSHISIKNVGGKMLNIPKRDVKRENDFQKLFLKS